MILLSLLSLQVSISNFIYLNFLVNEPTIKNHPSSCYTSRNIDYSAKLDEILNQEGLSSKFVIDEERNYNNEPISLLSESLGIKLVPIFLVLFTSIYLIYLFVRKL